MSVTSHLMVKSPKRKSITEMLGLLSSSHDCAEDGTPEIYQTKDVTISSIRGQTGDEKRVTKLYIDDQERFKEKTSKIITTLKESTNTCVFLDEDPLHLERNFTPFFEVEKSTTYGKYFAPYIKLHWAVDKKVGKILLTHLTGYREKWENVPVEEKQQDKIYQMLPSFTHVAIARLVRRGIFHNVITSSTGNQLRLAGIPEESIIELYGNMFREHCTSCEHYEKNSEIDLTKIKERVPTRCEVCGNRLSLSYIDIGDKIPFENLNKAKVTCIDADFKLIFDSDYLQDPFLELSLIGSKRMTCGLIGVTSHREKYDLNLYRPSYDLLIHLLSEFEIHLNK